MNVCRESGLRLILDTDPGVDDAIAILLALAAPRVDVAGLTTLGGNVPRARATRNALALLQAAGRLDIPVAQGAARPLTGRFRPSVAFHGPGGLSARLPEPASGPVGETPHRRTQNRDESPVQVPPTARMVRMVRKDSTNQHRC
jgi:inosine-uridine nucleoside N-ribohydrolase